MPTPDVVMPRMREVLGRLIKLSGMSRVEIGERLGGGPHLVRRILSGETELKARHVVEIAELIGVRPIEYFRIVFADESHEPSPLIRKLGAMAAELNGYRAGALGQAGPEVEPASKPARGGRMGRAGRRAPAEALAAADRSKRGGGRRAGGRSAAGRTTRGS
jgi:transcriptional regulator with XRE-family HTH domain